MRDSITSSLMQALADVEARFPVLEWTVAGLPVWPLLRVRWFFAEWPRHYAAKAAAPSARAAGLGARLVTGPVRAALAQWRDRSAPHGPGRRDLLFLSDGVSYGQLGGRWVERFCDPIIRAAAARGLTSRLLSPSYSLLTPRATRSCFIQPRLDRANAAGALLAPLMRRNARLPSVDAVGASLAAQGFDPSPLRRAKIVSDAVRLLALSGVHERIVLRTRPRLAFVLGYYGVENMAFVLACRRAGVRVVDLQHGAPGELHPAYARMPKPAGQLHALVADRFWVWSDWERGNIERWAAGTGHRVVVGGDPWMSVWEEHRRWDGVQEALARAAKLAARAGELPVVLITLQWGLHPREQLEPMRRLIAAGQGRFRFWARLHPSMLAQREEVRALLKDAGSLELDEPTDLPLPAVLSRCALHVTHSSSVAVEAVEFGVPTLVTSDLGTQLYQRLVDAGWVRTETGDAAKQLATLDALAAQRRSPRRSPISEARVRLDEALDELLAEAA